MFLKKETHNFENEIGMAEKFKVVFLPEAVSFMEGLEKRARRKIYYNIRKAQALCDQALFKKLSGEVWEFRTLYNRNCYRLYAFWDDITREGTIVVATHGIIKKTRKTPAQVIEKALRIRQQYFESEK